MSDERIMWKTEKVDAETGEKTVLSGEFTIDFPGTVDEAVEKYGEETSLLAIKKSVVIFLQAWARRQASKDEKPLSAEEIAAQANSIKIAFSEREVVDPVEKALAQFGKLTPEAKARLMASLSEMVVEEGAE